MSQRGRMIVVNFKEIFLIYGYLMLQYQAKQCLKVCVRSRPLSINVSKAGFAIFRFPEYFKRGTFIKGNYMHFVHISIMKIDLNLNCSQPIAIKRELDIEPYAKSHFHLYFYLDSLIVSWGR